jgi:hypothetical protein
MGSVYNLVCLGRIDVIMYNRAPLTYIGAESRYQSYKGRHNQTSAAASDMGGCELLPVKRKYTNPLEVDAARRSRTQPDAAGRTGRT